MNLFELFVKLGVNDEASGKIGNISNSLKNGLASAAKVATAAMAAASAAIVAFGKSAVDVGKQFDSAMSQVAATMGFTADELSESGSEAQQTFEQLRAYAMEMGASTAFSATQAADAINILAMAGYSAKDSIETLPAVLSMAAAGGLGIAEAADYATGIIAGFSNETLDVTTIADKLAKVASVAKGSVSSFGEGLSTVAGMANTTGQSMQDMTVALGILGNNNYAASEAGNALSRTLKNLYQPTTEAKSVMESFGVSAYTAEGKARPLQEVLIDLNKAVDGMSEQAKNEVLSQIFDAATLKSVPALLNNASDSWNTLDAQISSAWYTTQGLTKAFDDIGYAIDFDMFVDGFKDIGISAEQVNKALAASGGNAQKFANSIMGMLGKDADLDYFYQGMYMDLDELQMAFDKTTGAAQAMADVQLDNLEGDITLFKSALEGAQIVLSDQLTPTLREIVQFGSEAISKFSTAFQSEGLGGAMQELGNILSDAVAIIIDTLPKIISAGGQVLGALITGIIDNVPQLFAAAEQILSDLGEQLKILAPKLFDGLGAMFDTIAKYVTSRDTIAGVVGAALDLVVAVGQALPGMITSVINYLGDFIDNAVDVLTDAENLNKMIEAGVSFVVAIAQGIPKAVGRLVESAGKLITNLVNYFGNQENQAKLAKAASDMVDEIGNGIVAVVSTLGDAAISVITGLVDFLKDEKRVVELGEAGGEILGNIIGGIISALGDLFLAGAKIVAKLVDYFTGNDASLDISDIGGNILKGISAGAVKAWDTAKPKWDEVVEKLKSFFKDIDWQTTTDKMVDKLAEDLGRALARRDKKIQEIKDAVVKWFTEINWEDVGRAIVDGIRNGLSWTSPWDWGVDAAEIITGQDLSGLKIRANGKENWITGIGEGFADFIDGVGEKMGDFVKGMASSYMDEMEILNSEQSSRNVPNRTPTEEELEWLKKFAGVTINVETVPMSPGELFDEAEYRYKRVLID